MAPPSETVSARPSLRKRPNNVGNAGTDRVKQSGKSAVKLRAKQHWAHKIRNILDKVRKPDRDAVKDDPHAIMNAPNRPKALSAARRFADAWEETYPNAVACLRNDLDDLLTCFRYATLAERKQVRTTNAIERRFREVRRRTRPMGTFQDRTSMDRILFAVFTHQNKTQGTATPFPLTHKS